MIFINRKEEISILKERLKSNKGEFIVIYGRRRVGKSEIINEILRHNKGIKLLAREEAEHLQFKRFSEALSNFFDDELLKKNPLMNWDAFFTYINKHSNERLIIAIDEFPYLVSENKSIPSILQGYWDEKLRNSKIFLIICGSSISMMEKILGHKSPLYGRRTGQLLIKPFSFKESREYLKMDIEDAIKAYAVFGGTPAYILEYDLGKSLEQNIKEKILRMDSFLYRDAEFVLKEELREPRYYFSILSSIAKGNTKISNIMNDTGLDKTIVGKYLSILSELMMVKKEIPLLDDPLKSRKGLYKLSDNFFRFWFKFIYPNKEIIERNLESMEIINKTLNDYFGLIFEDICKEALEEVNKKENKFIKIGKWWYKDKEIDLIALNDKTKEIMFCECKWKDKVNAKKILEELKEKAKYVDWNNDKRKEYYAIFAKSFKDKIKEKNVYLFDLKDLENVFISRR